MFKILQKQILSHDVKRLDILAPLIAEKVLPGQFVSVSPEEGDERLPLAVIEADKNKKSIALIVRESGVTSRKFGAMAIGTEVFSILGPLGKPATIVNKGTVVCVATGVGIAQILPICRAFKEARNKVIGVVGAKTKKNLILEAQMRLTCHKIFITTEDGSYERKGKPTDILKDLIVKNEAGLVYAIGAAEMLEAICPMTKDKNIPTLVQVNPLMVDCVGICGSCRIKVDGKTVFACIDGPEFDGQKVDFSDLKIRMKALKEFGEWHSHSKTLSPNPSEAAPFRRFLSGILKK